MTRRQRGFTLVEVIIALTIVATLLVITFAGLRVGLAAWQRGACYLSRASRELPITYGSTTIFTQ